MAKDDSAANSAANTGAAGIPGAQPALERPGFARRHWGKLTLLGIVGLPLLAVLAWSAIALSYTYSNGSRTGYIQKLSKKGWLCKTWEGELAMATAPGVSPQIFTFTIWNDSLARALEQEMGEGRVALSYEEHRGIPTTCLGDTPYFVVSYRLIRDDGRAPVP